MINPASRRAGCPVCGIRHAVCGPPVAAEAEAKAVDQPEMLVRSKMTEQQEDQPKQLKRYRVQLDGNRGQAVMKLTEKDAERMGDRVLGEADSEQKTFGKPEEGRSTFADGTAGTGSTGGAGADPDAEPESEEEDAEPKAKAQTPANKSKPGRNK